MDYKSMTVFLDSGTGSMRRFEFALALAEQHGAHLTCLHLIYSPLIAYDPYAQWTELMREWEDSARDTQKKMMDKCRAIAERSNVNFDFVGYLSSDANQVLAHARMADLIIMGQRDPDDIESDFGNGFRESFVLRVGRPVLFLPYIGPTLSKLDTIFVAWDGGREATRALADAMPFLKQAKLVKILTVSRGKERDGELPDVDIASNLAKHGVNAEVEKNENVSMDPAEWLLSRAADVGADMLVMGAYGHTRISELVLGGVTRSLLREMTMPILMSH